MKRRNLLRSLGLLLAAKLRGQTGDQGSDSRLGRIVTARVAQSSQAGANYTIYTVGNVAGFLGMNLPLCHLVLWGGVILLPGIQYDASIKGITLRNLPLSAGDTITLITFPTGGLLGK